MQLDIQQLFTARLVMIRGCDVRATVDIEPVKRPWNNRYKMVLHGYSDRGQQCPCRVACGCVLFRVHHDWGKKVVNEGRFTSVAPTVDLQMLQTHLEEW